MLTLLQYDNILFAPEMTEIDDLRILFTLDTQGKGKTFLS